MHNNDTQVACCAVKRTTNYQGLCGMVACGIKRNEYEQLILNFFFKEIIMFATTAKKNRIYVRPTQVKHKMNGECKEIFHRVASLL